MPLYVYSCSDCSKVYEVKVPLEKYDDEIKCPHCGKPMKRWITPVRFKVN